MGTFGEDLFDEEGFRSERPNAPAEKHLRSPIVSSLLDRILELHDALVDHVESDRFFKGKHGYIPRNADLLINKFSRSRIEFSFSNLKGIATPLFRVLAMTARKPEVVSPTVYGELMARTLGSIEALKASIREADELYIDEIRGFSKWADTPELRQLAEREAMTKTRLNEDTYMRYESYRYWDFVVERYRSCKKSKKFGEKPVKIQDSTFYFFDGFLLEQLGEPVIIKKNGIVTSRRPPLRRLYTYEQAQMLQDACLARFNAFMAIDANIHNGSEKMRPLLVRLLHWQEDILEAYGNEGYDLVKGPESVAKSYLTTLTNGDVLPVSSFVRTVSKLAEKERKLSGTQHTPFTDRLTDIISETGDLWTASELFGCTKLSGHPFVYASVSAKSVQSEGCPPGNIDYMAVVGMHRTFKAMVLTRYLEKHRTWPPFVPDRSPRDGTKLHSLWRNESLHVPKDSYPLDEWDNVEFGKFMEFDYSPDYLDMIDDKAINPGAHLASAFWFSSPNGGHRRLLESLINKRDIDTFAIVERMRRGLFTPEERYIELTQKEREFKTSARCFCKLTFEVRLFYVLTEANLKRFMGGDSGDNGYLPQQTMTMSSTKLRQRMYDLTSGRKRDNTCLVEVDFSRWNLRWRAPSVNPISRTLESIFGLPGVFSQAHNFFESSTIVVTDKHTLPAGVRKGMHAKDWPESDIVWRNHGGGFEGIQQTLWTICTLAMMYFSLRDEECSFKMAGQGDNQVFYVSFNLKEQSMQTALLDFLRSMERESERLNHEVKPDECVDSSTVLTYGKEIYANGVHVLYSIKFSSRAFSRLDHSAPSLSKEIAGVVANSIIVSGTLNCTLKAIWWKHVQVLLLLRRRLASPMYRLEHPGLKRLLAGRNSRSALLIPGSLGGFPMMPWTRYFSKGETDDLSFDVAAMYYMSKGLPILRNYMSLLLDGEFTPNEVDVTNLLNDPHSAPIERPDDATHLIADAVGKRLPNLVKNKDLKPLVDTSLREKGEEYKRVLSEISPMHPQIVSDLFDLTPAGLYQKTVKRFTMTRTIEKLVPGIDMSERISMAGAKLISVILNRLVRAARTEGKKHPRPFDATSKLRDLWGIGLKNSSVGIYTPFDFRLGKFTNRHPTISAHIRPGARLLDEKGPFPPNFGTSTIAKVSNHGYRIVSCNSTMRDLKTAVLIFSELQGHDSIRPMIDSIIQARSPWKLEQLLPLFPTVYGGTAVHRHAASRHNFAVLGSCSVPTHIHFSSDNAGILSGGEVDYPVVFQTLYLTLTNLYQNLESAGIPLPSSLAYEVPERLDEIDTSVSKYDAAISPPRWPDLTGNKLAYVSDLFATEVPTVPDPSLIPHMQSVSNDVDLVYSYIESEISPGFSSYDIWDGILSPKDVFDFKEISRVNPYDVETALVWSALTETFFRLVSSEESSRPRGLLGRMLHKHCMIFSGMWIRMRLHPMFASSKYNEKRSVRMYPGETGYRRPVEYMCSIMKRRARTLLGRGGDWEVPKLILFNDWKTTTRVLSKRRLVLGHVIAMYPDCDIDEIRQHVLKSTPPSELLDRDPSTYMHVVTTPLTRRVRNLSYEFPSLSCAYMSMSAKEAFRLVRSRKLADSEKSSKSQIAKVSNHGFVRYTIEPGYGTLLPSLTEEDKPLDDVDRLRALDRRIIGSSSPLFSDWNAAIQCLLPLTTSRYPRAHLLGVGRGATARAFCDRGVECIGYDLNSLFPALSQRSSSYLPPEVLESINSGLFSWSDHTLLTDGNVMFGDLDLIDDSDTSVIVVDLDLDLPGLMNVLRRIPEERSLMVRHTGTEREIRYLIDVLRPEKVISLMISDGELRDAILHVIRLPPVAPGNWERVNIIKRSEISYVYDRHDLLKQLWDISPALARICEIPSDGSFDALKQKLTILTSERRSLTSAEFLPFHDLYSGISKDSFRRGHDLRILSIMRKILSH